MTASSASAGCEARRGADPVSRQVFTPSPNFDARPGPVDHLVLHYTGMPTGAEAIARLCDPASRVSAHYLVDEDGTLYCLVDEDQRAWHAGVSYWRGVRALNDRSIGIEIVNPGHEWGYRAYPPAQLDAVLALAQRIVSRHGIAPENVVGHSDIAPDRKQDPGELFPWAAFAAAGVGIWSDALAPAGDLAADLGAIGYDVSLPLGLVIAAFQRHFLPEALGEPPQGATAARAAALRRLTAGG